MYPLPRARLALAILFLGCLGVALFVNLRSRGPSFAERFSAEVWPPRSLGDVRDLFTAIQDTGEYYYPGKHLAWDWHARIQSFLGKSEMNTFAVIRAEDGRLYRGGLFPIDTGNAEMLAEAVTEVSRLAGDGGVKLMFFGVPDAVAKDAANLPVYMPYLDYNIALDSFFYKLREQDVHFVDSRYELLADAFPGSKISLRTGLHLTGEAAFVLFVHMLDDLRTRASLTLDPDGFYRDIANYRVETHPKLFLGQLGKETGPAFGGMDDFTALSPAFDSDFEIEGLDMFGRPIRAEGNAQETLFNPDALVTYGDPYNMYPEAYYIHSNATWSRVVNRRNPDGPKILLVHDSYNAQFASLLAPLCGELHTLSSQENGGDLNIQDFLADNEVDCVIVSLSSQSLLRRESQSLMLNPETLEDLVERLTVVETEE